MRFKRIKKFPQCALYAADTFSRSVCCASHLGINSLLWKQFLMLDKNEITFFCRRRVLYVAAASAAAGVREIFFVETFVTSLHRLWTVRFFLEQYFLVQCIAMHRNALGKIVKVPSSGLVFLETLNIIFEVNDEEKKFKEHYETHCSNVCAARHVRGIFLRLFFRWMSREKKIPRPQTTHLDALPRQTTSTKRNEIKINFVLVS